MLSIVLVVGRELNIAHVGDSRILLARKNMLCQLSEDHSMVAMLLANGTINYKDSLDHPDRNVILKSIGSKPRLSHGSRKEASVLWQSSLPPKDRNEQITGFIKEAWNINQCQHANIVKVYDWFRANHTAYIAMEFLPGQSLYDILQSQGPLPELKVKKYLLEIAQALKFIHSKQLLHRDIKQENILIDRQDSRQVLSAYKQAVQLYQKQGKLKLAQQIQQAFQRAGI